jgi:hypothetical protein
LNFDTSLFHTLSRQATAALFLSPDFLSRKWCVRIASGDLRPPSPPAEKATARQDQPWKSCADGSRIDAAMIFPVNKIPIFDCY